MIQFIPLMCIGPSDLWCLEYIYLSHLVIVFYVCCSSTKEEASQLNAVSAEQDNRNKDVFDELRKDIQALALSVQALDKKIGKILSILVIFMNDVIMMMLHPQPKFT